MLFRSGETVTQSCCPPPIFLRPHVGDAWSDEGQERQTDSQGFGFAQVGLLGFVALLKGASHG